MKSTRAPSRCHISVALFALPLCAALHVRLETSSSVKPNDAYSSHLVNKSAKTTCEKSVAAVPLKRSDDGNFMPCVDEFESRFRESVRSNCGGSCDVVFVGDSITEHSGLGEGCEGTQFSMERSSFRTHVETPLNILGFHSPLVLAAGKEQTQNMLWRFRELLPLRSDPFVFVILLGTNNIGIGDQQPADVACGVQEVVRAIHKHHPKSQVLLQALYPREDHESRFAARVEKSNVLMKRFVDDAGMPWLRFLDCGKHVVFNESYMPDSLHPSALQYDLLYSRCVMPALSDSLRILSSA
eukprot:TRINITY_DN74339_c0_g1_i1.p1 TRINITY_DN74339_c0_g1~~TRINITY_DN74339_c0_g1_i1.p1  ORF type:complete len:320 (-),score=26.88 TRINITY_DN74339_c0_g1_i1:57-950(-)